MGLVAYCPEVIEHQLGALGCLAKGDRNRQMPANAIVSSFDPPSLVAMRDRLPGWGRWLNAEDLDATTMSLAVGLDCRAVSVLWGGITPASMARARDAGLEVAAWTVRRTPTFERLGRLGVVAACVEGAALGPVADPVPDPRPA